MKSLPPYVYAIAALGAFVLYRNHINTAGGTVTANPDPYGTASATEFSGSGTAAPNGYYYDPNMTTPGTTIGAPNPVTTPVPVSTVGLPVPQPYPVTPAPIYVRPIGNIGPSPIPIPYEPGLPVEGGSYTSPVVSPVSIVPGRIPTPAPTPVPVVYY